MDKKKAKKLINGLMKKYGLSIQELDTGDVIDKKEATERSSEMRSADDIALEKIKQRLKERQRKQKTRPPRGNDSMHPNSKGVSSGSIVGGAPITNSPVLGDGKDISRRVWGR